MDKIRLALQSNNFKLSLNFEKFLESFQVSNSLQSDINSNILVLKAHQEILSIAGILVNKKFEYDNNTKSLVIEASIFNTKYIRQLSRTIKVRTDRSSIYEKELNSTYLIESLCRFLYLLKSLDNKIDINIHTVANFNKIEPIIICLDYQTVIQILGPIINNKTNKL